MRENDGDVQPDGALVTLASPTMGDCHGPAFTTAQLVPNFGMLLLQLSAALPGRGRIDLLASPPTDAAIAQLREEDGEFPGNKAFSMGGAFLLPYANRITGELSPDRQTVVAEILGKPVRLPANWGGQRGGAERYAMHGLALASPVTDLHRHTTQIADTVTGILNAGNFGGHWPSATRVTYEMSLCSDAFTATLTARNVGPEVLPMGIGWHPYFTLPSGHREQARMHVPAAQRTVVDNYDDVLPTGEIVPVAGTRYDFSSPAGSVLGDLYLDDCFVGLAKNDRGETVCEITDPEASYGLRIVAMSPHVTAVQIYSPPDKSFVALEPQFNWADPFGNEWPRGIDTGMVLLDPGESVSYSVRLELFAP